MDENNTFAIIGICINICIIAAVLIPYFIGKRKANNTK